MTILFSEGFEAYHDFDDLKLSKNIIYNSGSGSIETGGSYSIYGNRGLRVMSQLNADCPFITSSKTIFITFNMNSRYVYFDYKDAAGVTLASIEFPNSTTLNIYDGDGGLLYTLARSPTLMDSFAIRILFDKTVGELEVYENQVIRTSQTGLKTSAAASVDDQPVLAKLINKTVNQNVELGVDNIVINDDQGSTNNGFLGAVGVIGLFPTSDSTTQWTSSTGNPNYQNVNTIDTTIDTDFNEGTSPGNIDLYGMEDIAITGDTILGVQSFGRFLDVTGNDTQIKFKTQTGANSNESSAISSDNINTCVSSEIFEYQDGISILWDEASINAILAGVEVA